MAKPIDLPEDILHAAQAQVAAGRFSSVADVLRGGVDAVAEQQQAEQDWIAYARQEAAQAFAELDQGQGTPVTPDSLITRLDREVRARVAPRS